MTNRDGTPIWYELMTPDPGAAQAFYQPLARWTFHSPTGGMERDYRTFTGPDGDGVGGVLNMAGRGSVAAVWVVYFGVSDVDAMAARVTDLGGSIHMPPQDIPGVGRFAFVADPQGATFYLMRGASDADSTAYAPLKSGHCSWNELVTTDQDAAFGFYGQLFGWKKAGSMPMGALGEYAFVANGGADVFGAIMTTQTPDAAAFWNFAFTVDDIDAAHAAAEAGGGTITQEPVKLPGDQDGWFIQMTDPQGARVMFTGKRKMHG